MPGSGSGSTGGGAVIGGTGSGGTIPGSGITYVDYGSLPAGFEELDDTTQGSADQSGAGETRTYLVPWSGLYSFLELVAGTVVTGGSGSIAILSLPLQHPVVPGWFAQSMEWEKWGASRDPGGGGCITYDWARVKVNYRSWPFGFDPSQALRNAEFRAASQLVTVPGFNLFFPDGSRVYQDFPLRLGTAAIQVTRYRIGNVDAFNLLTLPLVGCVNSASFVIYGIEAGYVLLDGFETSTQQALDGTVTSQATLSYLYQSVPWGSAWNPAASQFQLVTGGSSSGPSPYPAADINPPITTL